MARKGAKGRGAEDLAAFFFSEQKSMMKAEVGEIVGDPMTVGRVGKSLQTLSFAIKVSQKGLCTCSIVVPQNCVFFFSAIVNLEVIVHSLSLSLSLDLFFSRRY
jgi:hypothetical protein